MMWQVLMGQPAMLQKLGLLVDDRHWILLEGQACGVPL